MSTVIDPVLKEKFKNNITTSLSVKLANDALKADLIHKYSILADAYYTNNDNCIKQINDNQILFDAITQDIIFYTFYLERNSKCYTNTINNNQNLKNLVNSIDNFKKARTKFCNDYTGELNADVITKLLNSFNVDTADELDEELFKELEEEESNIEFDSLEDDKSEDSSNKDISKFVTDKYSQYIHKTIQDIRIAYNGLFSSGYGVIEPDGLICDGPEGGAFLHFDKNNYKQAVFSSPAYLNDIWLILSNTLGLKQSNERKITFKQISEGYNYYPFKLLEFAFGRYTSDEKDINDMIYKKHASSSKWNDYFKEVIEKPMIENCTKIITDFISFKINEGFDITDKDTIQILNKVVKDELLNNIYRAYVPCLIMSELSDGRVKIRISDINKKLTPDIMKQVEDNLLNIIGSKETERVDRANSLSRLDGLIKEFEVVKDSRLCGALPLFAYTALDKLMEQGTLPSWDNLVLGRAEDDSIYIANNPNMGNKLNFKSESVIHISAGSRSGKGVMTLNILGSAIASGIPVFYLDSKPDMASLLKYISGGKMFAIQGGEYAPGADMGGVFANNGSNLRVPDCVKNCQDAELRTNMNGWSALQYFKALDFCIWLMAKVGKKADIGDITSDDRMIVVADEMWRFEGSFMPFIDKFKDLIPTKSQKDKGTANDLALYADKLTSWQIGNVNSWKGAKNATLKGTAPVLITIYQEMEKSTAKAVYNPDTKEGTLLGNGSVYRGLMDIGKAGLVGYSATKPHTLAHEPKGRKFLTYANRYFAYVPDIENQSESSAEFFKPFLILNDTKDENNSQSYVGQLKTQLSNNGLDPDEVLIKHRPGGTVDSPLNEAIGFMGYIEKMGGNVVESLRKSYDLANAVLKKMGYFEASGGQDVFDYLFDFRPEYLLSWAEMDAALKSGTFTKSDSSLTTGLNDVGDMTSVNSNKTDSWGLDGDDEIIPGFTPAKGMSKSAEDDFRAATAEMPIINKIMSYAQFSKLDNKSKDANLDRINKEMKNKFNTYDTGNNKFGLKHLCWNLSILHSVRMLNTNALHSSIMDFATNYATRLENGTYVYDYIPRNQDEINLLNTHIEFFTNSDGAAMANEGFSNINPNTYDNVDSTVMMDSSSGNEPIYKNTEGRNNIDISRLKVPAIKLDNTNSIDLNINSNSEGANRFKKMLFGTNVGTSYLFTQRTKSVIDAILKAIPDKNAITRLSIKDCQLVVNGRLVDTDPLIDDMYGVRFQDFVIVKQLLEKFSNIQSLVLDNTMFNQVITDYGDDAKSIWLIFQQNKALQRMEIQYDVGSEFKTVTRSDFRQRAVELQNNAKRNKLKQQIETVAATHNPRLADRGIGYSKNMFKEAKDLGGNIFNNLKSNNPSLLRGGLHAALAIGAIGVGITVGVSSRILKLIHRNN